MNKLTLECDSVNPSDICTKDQCCGCMACVSICPHSAISLEQDELAKLTPVIDPRLCVSCKLCVSVCPMTHLGDLQIGQTANPDCYALWANNANDRETCSSGGAATTFARLIIENGGVVYGAAFDNAFSLRHVAAEKTEDLEAFKGSKYVQSRTDNAYIQAREWLQSGREVLYISTPCQIAGLRSFLGREAHENLYTIDLICHGVPPMEYLSQHIRGLIGEQKVDSISFRSTDGFVITITGNNKELYRQPAGMDVYFSAFLDSIIYRDNCYSCAFANIPRISDITIGDFWGLGRETLKPRYNGRISLALLNTTHGHRLFERAKYRFSSQQRPLNEAVTGNRQLREPSRYPECDRETFVTHYPKLGFMGALKKTSVYSSVLKQRRRHFILESPLGAIAKSAKKTLQKWGVLR